MRIRASLPSKSIVIRVRRTISTVSRSIGELAVWIASPIDLVPEFIPIAGPLDDAIVAALVLRHLLRRTESERPVRPLARGPGNAPRLLLSRYLESELVSWPSP